MTRTPLEFFESLGVDTKSYNSGSHYVQCPKCHNERKKKASKELLVNFEYGYVECFHCGWNAHILSDAESRGEVIDWTPPPPKPQKFIEKEPAFNWIVPDVVIDPPATSPMTGKFNVTFYYRNIDGKLTGAKKVVYNFPEYKRDHASIPLHLFTRDSGYYPSLFYERDLVNYPSAKVVLVESEKTAGVLRKKFNIFLEEFIYLAVGGSNGLTEEKARALKNRDVLICYDCDNAGREGAMTANIRATGVAKSSKIVDIDPALSDGTDLADLIGDITIDTFRSMRGGNNIPPQLINAIRNHNIKGIPWNRQLADELGREHLYDHAKTYEIGRSYYNTHRDEHNLETLPLLKKIEYFLTSRFEFRRNMFTKKILYRAKDQSEFKFCNYNDIWRLLQHNLPAFGGKIKITITDVSNLLESEFVKETNPFRDYFHGLPHWDGHDHITALAGHITCTDQEFWLTQFKKALVRMIACTYGGIENRIIMVLVQERQNSGKSSALRFLCPPELKDYYKEDPMVYDKDTEIALSQNFMWNLEELAQLNKKEVTELKAIISRQKVKQRRAYARQEESMNRIVNFWGSTNKEEFLTDTSNSRWLCFKVVNISHDYNNYSSGVKNVDITKVWSQAWHLYKSGFVYTLDTKEQEQRDLNNREFETMTEEKQLMLKYLTRCDENNPEGEFLMNAEIHEYLLQQTHNKLRLSSERMGVSMSQLGFISKAKKFNGKIVRGYYVIKKPLPQQINGYHNGTTYSAPQHEVETDPSLPF
jgi:hypothetical protein